MVKVDFVCFVFFWVFFKVMDRQWPVDLTKDFIAKYRSHPCLWKVSDKLYLNRNKKNDAYQDLVEFCKPHFPDINRDILAKKIQSLRGSFRKEIKKVKTSKRSGASTNDIFSPTLWYYKLLLFTADSEVTADSFDNITTEDGDREITANIEGESTNDALSPEETVSVEQLGDSQTSNSNDSNMPTTSGYQQQKRQKKSFEEAQRSFMENCTQALASSNQDLDETEAVGLNVAKKLKRMDSLQAIFAEDLINAILRKGLMKQLTENTIVCETPRILESVTQSNQTGAFAYPDTVHMNGPRPTRESALGFPLFPDHQGDEFPSFTSV